MPFDGHNLKNIDHFESVNLRRDDLINNRRGGVFIAPRGVTVKYWSAKGENTIGPARRLLYRGSELSSPLEPNIFLDYFPFVRNVNEPAIYIPIAWRVSGIRGAKRLYYYYLH